MLIKAFQVVTVGCTAPHCSKQLMVELHRMMFIWHLDSASKNKDKASASERPSRLNSRPSSPLRSDKACFHFRPFVQAAILGTNRSPILKIAKAATGWPWLAGSHWTLRLDWRVLHALPCTLTHKHCLQELGNTYTTYTRVQA